MDRRDRKSQERKKMFFCMVGFIVLIFISRKDNDNLSQNPASDNTMEEYSKEPVDNIRVLIKTSDYQSLFHDEVLLTADVDFYVVKFSEQKGRVKSFDSGELVMIDKDSEYWQQGRMQFVTEAVCGKFYLPGVHRSEESPGYRGVIELIKTEDGIVVVNELNMEAYLCGVLPGEMPADYPSEALKAQAICARTYAFNHLQNAGYPAYGCHVDDSTTYQVYNNISEKPTCTAAVRETSGQVMVKTTGEFADTYYYSTSSGMGTDEGIWTKQKGQEIKYQRSKPINHKTMITACAGQKGNTDKHQKILYLDKEPEFEERIRNTDLDDFEASENWYRWKYVVEKVEVSQILSNLKNRYDADESAVLTKTRDGFVSEAVGDFTRIIDLSIEERGPGGVARELMLETDGGTYKVCSEYNIRMVLCNETGKLSGQDGREVEDTTILPSAFFVIDVGRKNEYVIGYTLIGGGFGHGVGMSQNAAKHMALEGYRCEDILHFFFEECRIERLKEQEGNDPDA